jgi:glucosamine--fructose-6-phosphate aminotransferase (isomerizing)
MEDPTPEIKRCQRCLLPATTPGLTIGEDGICSVCQGYQPLVVRGEDALRQELAYPDGKHADYDCLVPISGGADSVYTVFYLSRRMGLRLLCVHYDHGLGSENKLKVLEWVEKELGVEIIYYRWEAEKTKALIASSLRALLPYGPKTMQAALCRHCGYGIRAAIYSEMVARNLHSVWGKHPMENIPFRYCQEVDMPHFLLQRNGLEALRSLSLRYRQAQEVPSPGASPLKLMFSQMGYPSLPDTHQHLKNVPFYSFIPWDKQRMLRELEESGIDTQPLVNAHSDCTLPPIVDHVIRSAWTVGKQEVYVTNRVRAGLLSREEGLAQIQAMHTATTDRAPLQALGLSEQEIDQILQ